MPGLIAAQTSLNDLIAGLKDGLSHDITAERIELQLRAFRIGDAELAKFVNFQSGRYTRNLVHREAHFEVLVLCWSSGAVSAIHDHGGSRCFFKVHQGSLLVDDYSLLAGGREPGYAHLAHSGTRSLHEADIDRRSFDHDIHRVAALGGRTISLHVYAKALDRYLVFDAERRSCRSAVSRYDTPADPLAE